MLTMTMVRRRERGLRSKILDSCSTCRDINAYCLMALIAAVHVIAARIVLDGQETDCGNPANRTGTHALDNWPPVREMTR